MPKTVMRTKTMSVNEFSAINSYWAKDYFQRFNHEDYVGLDFVKQQFFSLYSLCQ